VNGKVYLVGAGPGDPELLTVKALRLLQTAGAVLHDDLVTPEILRLVPPTAHLLNVGKRCGKKKMLQEDINYLMLALAESGLRVVRLKSGDPMIFGRAGEEIKFLRRSNVPYKIVPGVTSGLGAAASTQIPLTHRRVASAVVFITAHRASEKDAPDWSKFVAGGATLVIYMPGQNYADLASKLAVAGLSGKTPCAIVSRATTRQQRTHVTSLSNLHRAPQLAAPTVLIVGEVVHFANAASVVEKFVIPQTADQTSAILPLQLSEDFRLAASTSVSSEE
jgi:uroporphyrin-III C-methyltransferase